MKITRIEKLTNERWINLYASEYQHDDHQGRWVFASRREKPYTGRVCDAVLMVAIWRSAGEMPRLVMIREYRVPVGEYVLGLPAGLIEPGESIEEAIRREMREETGFEVTAIKRITQPLYSSCGLTDEAAALAFIDVTGKMDSQQQLDAGEDIEVKLFDQAQVCALCADPELHIDAKAWSVLFAYQQMGKLE